MSKVTTNHARPQGDSSLTADSGERLLKPVLRTPNNRTGGG